MHIVFSITSRLTPTVFCSNNCYNQPFCNDRVNPKVNQSTRLATTGCLADELGSEKNRPFVAIVLHAIFANLFFHVASFMPSQASVSLFALPFPFLSYLIAT